MIPFTFYSPLTSYSFQSLTLSSVEWQQSMNNELQTIRKEAVTAYFKKLSWHMGTRGKTSVNVTALRTEISTRDFDTLTISRSTNHSTMIFHFKMQSDWQYQQFERVIHSRHSTLTKLGCNYKHEQRAQEELTSSNNRFFDEILMQHTVRIVQNHRSAHTVHTFNSPFPRISLDHTILFPSHSSVFFLFPL
jgi:hypothetical protein